MFTTAIIAFREFLEAFLLVGIFIGLDKKLMLGKRKEILLAALCGMVLSLAIPTIVFFLGKDVKASLTEEAADLVEGYLLTFSGFFLVYIVFTLHRFMTTYRNKTVAFAKQKMEEHIFDLSLFLTIVFFIAREGFEIALLIATTSLFSVFSSNFQGLLLGFSLAACIGILTSLGYSKLPLKKIFTYTEYGIIILGAAMVKNGISLLCVNYLHVHLENTIPLPLQFLPGEETIIGHIFHTVLGLGKEFSLAQLIIMAGYVFIIKYIYRRKELNFSSGNLKKNHL